MWKPYQQIDFSDLSSSYLIDTRDFKVSVHENCNFVKVEGHTKIKKHPNWYYHSPEEVKKLLDRYYKESGGESDWRFFVLKGEGKRLGWLKYITIQACQKGFIIYSDRDKQPLTKIMLSYKVRDSWTE